MRRQKSEWIRRGQAVCLCLAVAAASIAVPVMPVSAAGATAAGSVPAGLQAFESAAGTVSAAASVPDPAIGDSGSRRTISIRSLSDFEAFRQNCMEDRYSGGLTVSLDADLDFGGETFQPVPVFCGTFLGNGHVIKGFSIEDSDSVSGVFRYVEAGAVIDGLYVSGTIQASGEEKQVGGIAGINRGTIRNCSFSGNGSADEQLGGITGYNENGGVIESCVNEAELTGNWKVGGIAGENAGQIRFCANKGKVNTSGQLVEEESSSLNLSLNLTPGQGLDREELLRDVRDEKISDVGGIAGFSSGMIEGCTNEGAVGYQRTGYDIGGIAGRQSGQLTDCENSGVITGRKNVGGITGLLEPQLTVEYGNSTVDQVSDILDQMEVTKNSLSDKLETTGDDTVDSLDQVDAIAKEIRELAKDTRTEQTKRRKEFDTQASAKLDEIDNLLDDLELDLESSSAKSAARDLRKNVNHAKELLGMLTELPEGAAGGSGGEDDHEADGENDEGSLGGLSDQDLIPGSDLILDEDMPIESILQYWSEIASELETCAGNVATDVDDVIYDTVDGIERGIEDFKDQMDELKTAADDLKDLIRDYKNDLFEALDDTGDDVSTQMDRLTGELDDLTDYLKQQKDQLRQDKNQLSDQLDEIKDTIEEGRDRLKEERDDLTDEDTPLFEDVSAQAGDIGDGMIAGCANQGKVQADYQGGGVVGTVGLYAGLNPDEDIRLNGEESVHMSRYLLAQVKDSKNQGSVISRNDYAGGIAGAAWYGALLNNENYGDVVAEDGDYSGGIAGESQGTIRNCYNKSDVKGGRYIGGIAGKGKHLTGNVSMSRLMAEKGWRIGNIAGDVDEAGEISGNRYVKNEFGAINNATWQAQASGVTYEELMESGTLPEEFRSMKVTFVADEAVVKQITCDYGETIDAKEIPSIPEKQNYFGVWEETEPGAITWDRKIFAQYRPWIYTVSSSDDPKPLAVAEGNFMPEAGIVIGEVEMVKAPAGYKMTEAYAYKISDPDNPGQEQTVTLHILAGDADAAGIVTETGIQVLNAVRDGDYLVFQTEEQGKLVLLKRQNLWPVVIEIGILGLAGAVFLSKRKKTEKEEKEAGSK